MVYVTGGSLASCLSQLSAVLLAGMNSLNDLPAEQLVLCQNDALCEHPLLQLYLHACMTSLFSIGKTSSQISPVSSYTALLSGYEVAKRSCVPAGVLSLFEDSFLSVELCVHHEGARRDDEGALEGGCLMPTTMSSPGGAKPGLHLRRAPHQDGHL